MSIFSFGGSSSNKNHKQIVDDLNTLPSEPNGADQFQLLNKIEIKNADKLITEGIPSDFPVRVLREDPIREGLLFAGTEFGWNL